MIEYGTDQNPDLLAALRTGDWLDAQHFPPLRYAVPGILPEGSTLLVGPPKIGKSWAVLDLLLAIAAGGRALGAIPTGEARPVLYLALEDGNRRLQDRCRKLLAGEPIPKYFHYLTRIPPGRVLDVVAEWTERNPDAAAVVLDTLGKVMPPALIGESAYQRDYRVGGRLKLLADERAGLALLTNHHDRKAGSEDFVDSVSGTHGLAGAADTILVLTRQRQETDGVLKITGRDVAEGEYALTFADGMAWQVSGGDLAKAAEQARTARLTGDLGDRSAAIVTFVNSHAEGVRAGDVADHLGIDEKQTGEYLRRLEKSGRIARWSRGVYGSTHTPVGNVGSVGTDEPEPTLPTLPTALQEGS
ncbi:MAG: hypothetical protein AUI14_12160 [Actinobacteria bacterium 13_2_20CM_2_71_6]|nr:MAG: hypothetical protein AUI14_12160 [Actinobacteria bacterium 13_2_20CM_2_71_6]